ncbi:hypothetical protein Brsp01_51210 [Brucella sp. NBRC 12950]|nr:hypothetical protein Brsp01_51210 [Brucella sp. NBRC 12950]
MNRIISAKIYHGALSVEVGCQDKEAATFSDVRPRSAAGPIPLGRLRHFMPNCGTAQPTPPQRNV